ncbi:hypothetical protein Tco_0791943 [Tanacetum coccineum]
MFVANLSLADPIYDEVGLSCDSDILSEVQDHDNYQYTVGEYHDVHEMQNDVQPNYVVDSDTDYTSDSNRVGQCVSTNEQNKVVIESLTAELSRYKEQVELYEKRARRGKRFRTKECYLTEVISFFKTIKEHFEGIQKALIKKVKEMKEIFEQMEAEVDQNAVDKKTNEIERKNLLIENENLIVDFLSNELLYSVMNSVNTVSRFSELHDAFTVEQAHNVDFEAEISKLKYKIQKDDHSEMIKRFSNLEVEHLNFQLKYQHLKKRFENIKSQSSQDAPEFDSFFEIKQLKEQLQERGNTIRELKEKISHLNKKRSEADLILDSKALDSRNKELTEHIKGKMKCVTIDTVKPKVLSLGVNCSTEASGSKPRSNTKNNRILSAKSVNKKKVEDPPWNNKSNLKQKNRVDSSISYKHTCVVKYLNYVNAPPFVKNVVSKVKQVWKATRKLFTNVGYQWKPTGKKFTLGEQCPLTRFMKSKVVPLQQHENVSTSETVITEKLSNTAQKPLTRYKRRNKQDKAISTSIPLQLRHRQLMLL